MRKDLTNEQLLLADFMGEISERCYNAGWMQNLEYILWDALTNGERKYGSETITQEDIEIWKDKSIAAKSWIIMDYETEEIAINLDEWKHKYQQEIVRNPELLKR
jgi:hypothetical protein